jgi:hypothetical protein
VRFAREAEVHAVVCAPASRLAASDGAVLEGRFAANVIRAGHVTVTGVVATTTTTTTLPPVCGNSVLESGEDCDPPGADCPGATTCDADCHCPAVPTTTTTSSSTSTTTTTLPVCGDGIVSGTEQCDPAAPVPGCGPQQVCTACACAPIPVEICDNCIDDDGNGLADFEDPACCGGHAPFALALTRGRIKSQGLTTSKVDLRGTLAASGLDRVNFLRHEVVLQIRPEGGNQLLCARVPAGALHKSGNAFRFRDRKRTIESAQGLQTLVIGVRPDRSVNLHAKGSRVRLRTPHDGTLDVTVGLRNPGGNAESFCSTAVVPFRVGPQGQLMLP